MTAADHDPMAYDEVDDPAGDNLPGHIVNPDAWQARQSAGASLWVIAARIVLVVLSAAAIWGWAR